MNIKTNVLGHLNIHTSSHLIYYVNWKWDIQTSKKAVCDELVQLKTQRQSSGQTRYILSRQIINIISKSKLPWPHIYRSVLRYVKPIKYSSHRCTCACMVHFHACQFGIVCIHACKCALMHAHTIYTRGLCQLEYSNNWPSCFTCRCSGCSNLLIFLVVWVVTISHLVESYCLHNAQKQTLWLCDMKERKECVIWG